MKRLLLTAIALLGVSAAYSQVGIGTRTPHNSAQLEVTVDGQSEKRGILIPRVELQNTNSMNPIVNTGTLPSSLLVFNTAVSGTAPFGVTPGYYYWYDNKWHKMISNSDDANTTNVSLTKDGQNLVLTDSDGNSVQIALSDLQTITTLVDNNDGTYTYTSEDGTVTTIDVPADVIQNFQDIMNDSSVSNIINQIIAANETLTILSYDAATKTLTYKDEEGQTTSLDMAQLVSDSETVTTLSDNNDGTYTYTSEDGTVTTIDVPADVIQNFQDIMNYSSVSNIINQIIAANETLTILSYDATTKTLTYKDEDGQTTSINMAQLVSDSETVTTLTNNNDGTYTYTNEAGATVTIDVPADVVSNFQEIINNTEVLNQLIENLTNTSVGGNVSYDGSNFTYVDNTGASHTINIEDLVHANETVTTLADNNDGTYTYTNEAGATVTIDVPADVIQNFQDIMNDSSVSTIINNIIAANETLTILGYDPSTKTLTYKDEDGQTTSIDMGQLVAGNETVTTLADNNDGTYTYTNEAGATVTIDVPADVVSNFQEIINNTEVLNQLIENLTNTSVGGNVSYDGSNFTYVDNTGASHTINIEDLVHANETVTTLADNNDGTYTYTNEAGATVTIDVPADVIQNFQDIMNDSSVSTIINNIIAANETLTILGYDPSTKTLTYKDEDGQTTSIDMGQLVAGNETVTTLADNNDGTYTYTNEAGATVTIDVPADVVSNFQEIINNTEVLNQLIENLTNTSVGGNVSYDGSNFTYVDNTGASHTINIEDLVHANETVTTLADNNDGTYTYTNEAGATVTIDVPADVVSNFQEIINNTEVLNQLIENLTNTSVGGNVSYDGSNFTYVDNTGASHTINIEDLVHANETVTTLADNNDGTYTYTNEAGATVTIDVPADVIQNFQDIMNDSSVSTIINNIIAANETLTILGYDPSTKTLTYKDEDGQTTSIDMGQLVAGNETVTTLADNNDGTYTYTNEAGATVTIDVPADVIQNFQDIMNDSSVSTIINNIIAENETLTILGYDPSTKTLTYKDEDGQTTSIDMGQLVAGNETVTTLADNNDGTYTYTNEAGATVTIDVPADVVSNFHEIINNTEVLNQLVENLTNTSVGGNVSYDGSNFTYVDNTGASHTINIEDLVHANETVTTLADNNDGTYTYTNETGATVTIDVPADVIQNFQDIMNDSSVSTIINNIIAANETLTILGYDTNTKMLTYKDEDGQMTYIDMAQLVAGTTTNTLNNPVNTITSTVNGVQATAPAVNTVVNSLSGSNLTTTVNGVNSNALNLATVVSANDRIATVSDGTNTAVTATTTGNTTDYKVNVATANGTALGVVKEAGINPTVNIAADGTLSLNAAGVQNNQNTSSVVNGTTTTVTSAVTGNNTAYKVEVNPSAIQSNQMTTSVTGSGLANVTSSTTGNNTAYNVAVTAADIQASQKLTTVSNGTNTTVTSTTTGNTTDYKVNVAPANGTTLGVVKQAATSPTVNVAADGTLSVNTAGIGNNFTSTDLTITGGTGATLTGVTANIATGAVTSTKIADGTIVPADIANAGNNQVLTTDGSGTPIWINQSSLVPAMTHTLTNPVNTITSTVNGVQATAPAVNTVVNSLSGSNLTTTVNGVGSIALDLTSAIAANDKTAVVVAGANTTVTNSVSGNTTTYTVNAPAANGTTLGVVKQAASNPTVNVAADGTLSVNTAGIGNNFSSTDLTITGGTGATLTGVTANIATGAVTSVKIADGTIVPADIANAGNNQVLATNASGVPAWVNQSALPFQNIYNTDGSLTGNRTVDLNTRTLAFRSTSLPTTAPETRQTLFDYANGTRMALGTATGTSNITLTSGTSNLDFIQNSGGLSQIVSSGTATGFSIGTALGSGTALQLRSNGATRVRVDANGFVGIGFGTTGTNALTSPTNALHVGASDPVRFEGLQIGTTTDNVVVATSTGVLKTITPGSFVAAHDKTAVVAAGANTTVTNSVSGNTTTYTVNAPAANGTTLGVVKQAASNPTVNVAADGTLSVNTAGIGNDFTSTDLTITGGTGATLTGVTASIATGAVTSAKIADATIVPADIANAGNNQVLTTNASGMPTWINQSALVPAITVSNTSTANNLSTTVNGITGTAVPIINSISNTSSANNLKTTVNGVDGADVSIINSNALSINGSNQLVSTVNGVASTGLDLTAAVAEPWKVQGGTTNANSNTQNIYQMGNVAIGAGATALTGADASAKLHVNGTITTATSLYADYVFEDYFDGASKLNSEYSFKSLDEVEAFINENKHLPGITGIKGLAKNEKGEYIFNLSELTVQVLEKVEELYLHTIEQQKQIDAKDIEIQALKDAVKSMDERLKRIEERSNAKPEGKN